MCLDVDKFSKFKKMKNDIKEYVQSLKFVCEYKKTMKE